MRGAVQNASRYIQQWRNRNIAKIFAITKQVNCTTNSVVGGTIVGNKSYNFLNLSQLATEIFEK